MEKISLKFYIFDWDDNVLSMNTKIFMQQRVNGDWLDVEVSTDDYGRILPTLTEPGCEYRFPLTLTGENDLSKAFFNFTDRENTACNLTFLNDCVDAITNQQYGPSFAAFKECLLGGHLFMICTARGHNPDTIKRVVQHFVDAFSDAERNAFYANVQRFHQVFVGGHTSSKALLVWYLANGMYVGVTSPYFTTTFGVRLRPNDVAAGKAVAVQHFVEKTNTLYRKYPQIIKEISIGVSDDSRENLDAMVGAIQALKNEHGITYVIYDTSKVNHEHIYHKTTLPHATV